MKMSQKITDCKYLENSLDNFYDGVSFSKVASLQCKDSNCAVSWSSILQATWRNFLTLGSKNRKNRLKKKLLYFREMLSGSNIKKSLIFQETEALANFLYFRK